MSKELEALNDLGSRLASVDTSSTIEEDHDDVFPIIRKALTPPTQEEVCEKLSELTRTSVYYSNGRFRFHSDIYGEIIDLNELPKTYITLIGRFYEGLKK